MLFAPSTPHYETVWRDRATRCAVRQRCRRPANRKTENLLSVHWPSSLDPSKLEICDTDAARPIPELRFARDGQPASARSERPQEQEQAHNLGMGL